MTVLHMSWPGVGFTACREALVLVPYPDGEHHSRGLGINGPHVKDGGPITVAQAFAEFREDMEGRGVTIGRHINVHLCQHMQDAILCCAFNIGNGALLRSPMIERLNAHDYTGAADVFPTLLKDKPEGRVRDGLLKRRLLERALFLDADYGDISRIPFWTGNPRTTEKRWMTFPAHEEGLSDVAV